MCHQLGWGGERERDQLLPGREARLPMCPLFRSLGTSIIPPLLGLGPQLRDRLVVCPPSYPCSQNSHGNSMATATSKEVACRKIEDLALVSRDRGYRKNNVTLQWESQKCSLRFRPLVPNTSRSSEQPRAFLNSVINGMSRKVFFFLVKQSLI